MLSKKKKKSFSNSQLTVSAASKAFFPLLSCHPTPTHRQIYKDIAYDESLSRIVFYVFFKEKKTRRSLKA